MTLAAELRRHPLHLPSLNRWVQVIAGVVAMMAIAAVLWVWPLLRSGSGTSLTETLAATENAFAFFILAETIFVPLEAWLGDRFPRWLLVGVGLVLVALGALAGAGAVSMRARLGWYALGGAGAGLAYAGTVGKALRRFTDRKALCVGVTATACAAVLALALGAIVALSSSAAMPVIILLGAGQAFVIVMATLFILYPPPERPPPDW